MSMTQRMDYARIGETLYSYESRNGLKVLVVPKPGYARKYANYATNFGSVDNYYELEGEPEAVLLPDGIAHFLEHKLFEGEQEDVMHRFARMGASPNAYTSFSKTVYLFSCTRNFEDSLKLLLDFVQHPNMTEESVEKEKGIIQQEIDMYVDNPGWSIYFGLLKGLYADHPVRIEIAGSRESLARINRDLLYKCHANFYNPLNMMMVAVGDFDPDMIFRIVEEGIDPAIKPVHVKKISRPFLPGVAEPLVRRKMKVSAPMFMLGFKEIPSAQEGIEFLRTEIAMDLILDLLAGRSTPFHEELYSRGLINDTFEYEYTAERDFAFTLFGSESPRPEEAADRIIQELERVRRQGFDEAAFDRVRKSAFGQFLRSFNSVDSIARNLLHTGFNQAGLLDYAEIYDTISLDFLYKTMSSRFQPGNFTVSLAEPV
ncbi:MAG TPA: peptidase M16 [Clostridiales bacterium]|nr:peptidase M16 [Clostridiales bacterium]